LGHPANSNGFGVLAALLHGILVVGVSQTAALNRGRHLYSAGRPSRWALAHISSLSFVFVHLFVFSILYVFWFSLDCFVLVLFAFVVLGLVSPVLCHEVGWEEHLQNELFCVECDVKTLTQSMLVC